jgi:hypothetical protein
MDAQPSTLSKCSTGFGLSLAVASVVNAVLVVAKEKSPALQAQMKSLTGHHWITHSAIVIAIFFVLGWILSVKGVKFTACAVLRTLIGGVLLGTLIIVGFYLFAD